MLQIGSDCPYFINNKPRYVSGRGEKLEPINLEHLSNCKIVLINPNIHIGTKEGHSGVRPQASNQDLKYIISQPIEKWNSLNLKMILNILYSPNTQL